MAINNFEKILVLYPSFDKEKGNPPNSYGCLETCLALKEEGCKVILCSSNPSSIMTDSFIVDQVYVDPLTKDYLMEVIEKENPYGILPIPGSLSAMKLAEELQEEGYLGERNIKLLGNSLETMKVAKSPEALYSFLTKINEPYLHNYKVKSIERGLEVSKSVGYPVIIFTDNHENQKKFCVSTFDEAKSALEEIFQETGNHGAKIKKDIRGFKEISYEVIRDNNDTAIVVINMETLNPVTNIRKNSLAVCPSQTLTNREYQMLRTSALNIVRNMKIQGGCNIRFALDPDSFAYCVLEITPGFSPNSALISKACNYPIAKVSGKIALGMALDEIRLANTPASFEPAIDYIVTKMPRLTMPPESEEETNPSYKTKKEEWNHVKAHHESKDDDFVYAHIMSIGRTIEESWLKALRSIDENILYKYLTKFRDFTQDELMDYVSGDFDDRLFAVGELLRRNVDFGLIYDVTSINMFFLDKIRNIIEIEETLKEKPMDIDMLKVGKYFGFPDSHIAHLWNCSDIYIYELRLKHKIFPVYKTIDSCAGEFESHIPYYYSTYEEENESIVNNSNKIIILGSGPVKPGEKSAFDYSVYFAIKAVQKAGLEAIVINNNPETLSTDYSMSNKVYFDPISIEDVINVVHLEKPIGVITSLGGKAAVAMSDPLEKHGVTIIGY